MADEKKPTFVYMKVTHDKYELPVAVAESKKELAEILGMKRATIESIYSHAKDRKKFCAYRKVEIDDD